MDYIQKHLYWDIYGVRTFSYRGKRKYFPCIYQDYDGTIMIRNDVFGLTIAQFEREFKACLARRKEKEQEIQNIRFPDKSCIQYIDYLKLGDDTVHGFKRVRELLDEEPYLRCLFENAGIERDIRIRQRMFIVMDKIWQVSKTSSLRKISSGSLAEGIDLPGSDINEMHIYSKIRVIDDVNIQHLSTGNTLLMENDINHPGFCKLKVIVGERYTDPIVRDSHVVVNCDTYLCTEKFLQRHLNWLPLQSHSIHGPCLSDPKQEVDFAFCLRTTCWPNIAHHWSNRHRKSQWPPQTVVSSILAEGCLLVPIAPRHSENKLLWRISFSMAEKRLIHSMNYTQLLCYILLKFTLKNIINREEQISDLLCSYFLKTTLFWLSEEYSINTFTIDNLSHCYFLCIEKLISFVRTCYCPNYFIPQHNMFIGKIDERNNEPLLRILGRIQNTELPIILGYIFGRHIMHGRGLTTEQEHDVSINVEFLFYRVVAYNGFETVETACTALQNIKSMMKLESSDFILGVLRFHYAMINQHISQQLELSDHRRKRYSTIQRCHKHLMKGTLSDSVSGWLLYASFYYVLGDYRETLQIVDRVLSRFSNNMILLGDLNYPENEKETYKYKTNTNMTLNQKMRQATVQSVCFGKKSTLIPTELQLEVQDRSLVVPPGVMSHCLRFLCYYHLNDDSNKNLALHQLYLSWKFEKNRYWDSQILTMVGVCHELSGDKILAYNCYNEALQCRYRVWPSAERRLENLVRK